MLFFSAREYYQQLCGERVFRVPVDTRASCPNLDGTIGTEGCIYCDAAHTGSTLNKSDKPPENQIMERVTQMNLQGKKRLLLYFQNNSFTWRTAAEIDHLLEKLLELYPFYGFSIATRPDCLDAEKIKIIKKYAERYEDAWVELGLQTSDNKVLKIINRGHFYEDFRRSSFMLLSAGIKTMAHVIIGLPGAEKNQAEKDAAELAGLGINGIKFHNIMVLRGTGIAALYQAGKFRVIDRTEYLDNLAAALSRLKPDTVIFRISADAPSALLLAPLWCLEKQKLREDLEKELKARALFQGKYS